MYLYSSFCLFAEKEKRNHKLILFVFVSGINRPERTTWNEFKRGFKLGLPLGGLVVSIGVMIWVIWQSSRIGGMRRWWRL